MSGTFVPKVRVVPDYRDINPKTAQAVAITFTAEDTTGSDQECEQPWVHFIFASESTAKVFAQLAKDCRLVVDDIFDFDGSPSLHILGALETIFRDMHIQRIS